MATPRLSVVLSLVGVLTGCASAPPPASRPISEVLEQASGAGLMKTGEAIRHGLGEQETFGYVAPVVPVVLPPEIRRVWVLTHIGPDGTLVSGHWVYLRLTDWRWFIETEAGPPRLGATPAAAPIGPAPPSPPPLPRPSSGQGRSVLPWVEGTPHAAPGPAVGGTGLEQGQVPTLQVLPPGSPDAGPELPSPPRPEPEGPPGSETRPGGPTQ